MKVLVQWALIIPQSWEEIDSKVWPSLPQGPVPDDLNPDHRVSIQKRWIHAIKINNTVLMGFDHYVVEETPNGVVATCWNDDTGDWVGDRHAEVWEFTERLYTFEVFAESPNRMAKYRSVGYCVGVYPWRSFEAPSNRITRHGIWVSNELHQQLVALQ